MVKFCPFVAASSIWVPVAGMGHIFGLVVGRDIDELKNEGPSSNDSTAAGEEVATNNVLEDGRLSSGLGSNDNLSWRARIVSILVAEKEGKRRTTGQMGTGALGRLGQGEVAGVERKDEGGGRLLRTIWGRSKESFPMVLKTKSCNLLTTPNRSSPRAAMTTVEQIKGREYQSRLRSASEKVGGSRSWRKL